MFVCCNDIQVLAVFLLVSDKRRVCRAGQNSAGIVYNAGRRRPFFLRGRISALVEFEYLREQQKLGGMAQVVSGQPYANPAAIGP